jgi:hypothetical protein
MLRFKPWPIDPDHSSGPTIDRSCAILSLQYSLISISVPYILERRVPVTLGSDGLGTSLTAKRIGDNAGGGTGAESFLAMAMRTMTVWNAIDIMGVTWDRVSEVMA